MACMHLCMCVSVCLCVCGMYVCGVCMVCICVCCICVVYTWCMYGKWVCMVVVYLVWYMWGWGREPPFPRNHLSASSESLNEVMVAWLSRRKHTHLFIPEFKQIQCRLELSLFPPLLPPRECPYTELLLRQAAPPWSCLLPPPHPTKKQNQDTQRLSCKCSFPSALAETGG